MSRTKRCTATRETARVNSTFWLIRMNKEEAKELILAELDAFRDKPNSKLIQMIDAAPITEELTGPGGNRYQLEIQAFWDDRPDGNIRVMGSVDDGGLRACFPLTGRLNKKPVR